MNKNSHGYLEALINEEVKPPLLLQLKIKSIMEEISAKKTCHIETKKYYQRFEMPVSKDGGSYENRKME